VFRIRDVDTSDEGQLRQWYDVWRAAQPHRRADLIPSWDAAGRALSTSPPGFELQLFTAFDGDTPVGACLANLPLDTLAGEASSENPASGWTLQAAGFTMITERDTRQAWIRESS